MTLSEAVLYIESLGHKVVPAPRNCKYVIRLNSGGSTYPVPISAHSVVANAIAWKANPDLRPQVIKSGIGFTRK